MTGRLLQTCASQVIVLKKFISMNQCFINVVTWSKRLMLDVLFVGIMRHASIYNSL